jgi:hypothetical protein
MMYILLHISYDTYFITLSLLSLYPALIKGYLLPMYAINSVSLFHLSRFMIFQPV